MTRAEIRATLTAFRDMVRARGPRECLEVAAMRQPEASMSRYERWWAWQCKLICARAALRWWRWANRGLRNVTVHMHTSTAYLEVWAPDYDCGVEPWAL